MTDLSIEHFRLEAIKLAIASGLHSRAAEFVHLVEHGCLPPAGAQPPPAAITRPAAPLPPPLPPAPPPAPAAGENSPAAPARSAAQIPGQLGALPRWTPERQALLHRLMAPHTAPYHGVTWHAYADQLTALAGPPVAAPQARAWWFKVGAFHRAAAEQATREATHVQLDA